MEPSRLHGGNCSDVSTCIEASYTRCELPCVDHLSAFEICPPVLRRCGEFVESGCHEVYTDGQPALSPASWSFYTSESSRPSGPFMVGALQCGLAPLRIRLRCEPLLLVPPQL